MDIFLLPPVWRVYCCAVAAVFGAALGSFLNCAAWRIARGEPFVRGRSRCPACSHTLAARDLVPVFSWLILRGRCRYCGEKVSARYPLTELLFALSAVTCLLRFGVSVEAARNLAFLACLLCLSLVDLDAMLIPDGCLVCAALAWAVSAPFLGLTWGDALRAVAAGLVYGGALLGLSLVMDKLMGRETLGGGDVKLLAVAGLYLGFVGTLFTLLLACVLGLAFALALKKRAGQAFPFGPALSAAAAGMLLFGGGLTEWYLGLLGL